VSMIFAPLTLLMFYWGSVQMFAFLGVILALMLNELQTIYRDEGYKISPLVTVLGMLIYMASALEQHFLLLGIFLMGLIVLSSLYIFSNQPSGALSKLAISIFTMIYPAYFLSMLYRLRALEDGRSIVISLIAVIWLTDTAAYFCGMLLGRRKGIIKISPNKTLEGYLGGIIFALAGSGFMVMFWQLDKQFIWMLAITGGIIGQYGDLFESLLKRDLQIKDSSRLLQEHGGILDRFDSLLFAAPSLYVIIKLFGVN
jgi:phosphatidate cytidylyltransferase